MPESPALRAARPVDNQLEYLRQHIVHILEKQRHSEKIKRMQPFLVTLQEAAGLSEETCQRMRQQVYHLSSRISSSAKGINFAAKLSPEYYQRMCLEQGLDWQPQVLNPKLLRFPET